MKKRNLTILIFMLLLISAGVVIAQSSSNYRSQRFVMHGGETAVSTNFKVNVVIGQPLTNVAVSSNHKVSGGFLFPIRQGGTGEQIWLPLISN